MSSETDNSIRRKHVIACLWDFDKTLIDGYMQAPIFEEYGVDEKLFWKEVNMLPQLYAQRGVRVAPESVYLNHLLTFVRAGIMGGLNNAKLRELGGRLKFRAGLPEFFDTLRNAVAERAARENLDISLEHYIISTGLAEMIRGSAIAPHVDGIFGCEFVEEPFPPYFSRQSEFTLADLSKRITQIGMIVDNTIKTRFVFEINKGTNKNPQIDVNANIAASDRRVPVRNMIYVADGPSDVPVFSVVRKGGGKTFAVYTAGSEAEFAQNDMLLESGRIDAYNVADFSPTSPTALWLKMHVLKMCDRIAKEVDEAVRERLVRPPHHIHPTVPTPEEIRPDSPRREPTLF